MSYMKRLSPGKFRWTGYQEFKAELKNLPAALHGEASHIVEAHANRVALFVRQRYGYKTGALIAGVRVEEVPGDALYTGFRVVSAGQLADIYERGTKKRANRHGDNRGAMPRFNVLGPIAAEQRFRMYAEIRQMMKRHGLKV